MATIAAVILAARLHWTAHRIDWVVACEQMKYGSGENFEFGPYKDSDILIVSDVDRPDYTLFVNRKLGELVRSREDKVTIWTSNTPLDTFCRRIETSSRRDERSGYNGVGKMQAAKMRETAVTIRSRLKGRMGLGVPFESSRGDWREKRE
jgi:hypothetical protein